jgi:hypothetical protein
MHFEIPVIGFGVEIVTTELTVKECLGIILKVCWHSTDVKPRPLFSSSALLSALQNLMIEKKGLQIS